MSKTLFNAYINSDSSSFDLKKEKEENIMESAFDIRPEKEDSKYAVVDDFFTKKKVVQEADEVDTSSTTTTDTTSTNIPDIPDTSNIPDTPDTSNIPDTPVDTSSNTPDTSTTSTETVQEGVVDKVKEHFSKDKRKERSAERKLKKLKYDPQTKTIEFIDDAGESHRLKLNISDERSLRKAIDEIDKELAKFASNDKATNQKLIKQRNDLVRELTEYVESAAYASLDWQGNLSITVDSGMLEDLSDKELLSIIEHESEHIRQFSRTKGVQSTDDPYLLLIDDDSLKFINDWRNSEKGRGLSVDHDRFDFELTADAAAIRKYGYKKIQTGLKKTLNRMISQEQLENSFTDVFRILDKDFKRIKDMTLLVGKSDEDLSDEEVKKVFKDVRSRLDVLRTALFKTIQAMIMNAKIAKANIKQKIKKFVMLLSQLFKEIKTPYRYCSKFVEKEMIKRLNPNERREAIRYLADSKFNELLKKANIEDMGSFCESIVEENMKVLQARLDFAKDYNDWYRKHRDRFIKEYLEYEFNNIGIICEGYLVENLVEAISEAEFYDESYTDSDTIEKLRANVNEEIGDRFKVTNVQKFSNGDKSFKIMDDNISTIVTDLGDGCKAVSRGDNKTKLQFAKLPYDEALRHLAKVYETPNTLMEGFLYDVSRFGSKSIYQEADEDDGKSSEEILDETVEEASKSESTDTEEADESIEELTDKALSEIKDDIDDIKEDNDTEEATVEVEISDDDELADFGTDTSDVQNDFDPKDIEILNKLVASESDAINDYFDAAKDCNDETLRRLYGDIGHEERFHLEQLLYAKSTLTGEKYEPKDPEVKKEYEELLAMGMDEDTAANTAIDKAYTASGDESTEEEIAQEVADVYRDMLRENMINDIIFEQFDKKELDETMGVFVETYIYQEEMMNSSYASKEMKSIPNPFKLLLKAFTGFINMLMKLGHSLKESYTRSNMKRKARYEWIKANGIAGLFKSGIHLYFYNPKLSKVDVTDPCRYVDLLYRMSVMIGKQCGITVTTKHKTIKDPIQFSSIDQAVGILKNAMFTKTKVVVTDSNKDIIARDFFGYNPTKINVDVKHGDDAPTINDSDNAYNSLDILINVTQQYAEISKEVLEQLDKLEGDATSVFYKNRSLYNSSVKNMKLVVNYFNKFITAIGHDMNTMLKLDQGLMEMTRQRDTVEQTGGKWEGPDVRTTQGTAIYNNQGEHTKVNTGGKLTDRAAKKAARQAEKAQKKMEKKSGK